MIYDLDVLEIAGVPWFYDRHEKCYRVRSGFKFSISNLSPDGLLGQAPATVITKAVGLESGVFLSDESECRRPKELLPGREILAWG